MKLQKGKGWNKEKVIPVTHIKRRKTKKIKVIPINQKNKKKLALMLPEENGRRFLNALQEISNT